MILLATASCEDTISVRPELVSLGAVLRAGSGPSSPNPTASRLAADRRCCPDLPPLLQRTQTILTMCYNNPMEHANTDPAGASAVAEETLEQLIARAKAEGNPWALAAGIFPDDSLTRAWIAEMQAARQRTEESPGF